MTWRLRSGPGSFRGVPFYIESIDLGGGRKIVVHEYPLQDDRFVEDLGRAGSSISVEGYLIGDDFIDKRDQLKDAFEQGGPGRLFLPYIAVETRDFIASDWAFREQREEGGISRFVATFLETASEPIFPMQMTDLMGSVDGRVKGLLEVAQAALPAAMNTKGQPFEFLKSLSSVVSAGANAVKAALAPVNTAVSTITGAVDQASQFAADVNRQLDGIIRDADRLVRSPFVAADRFRDAFEALFESPALPPRNLDALLEAYEFESDTPRPQPVTSNREREANNYDALQLMIQRMALASAARFAPRVEYTSFQEAVATRDRITALLDEQIEVADDELLPVLADLRAALVQAVPGETSDLPRLLNFTPPVTLPSLVIAHRLHGNVDKELDLVARNNIRHPGFVVGGRALEVLSDA